MALLHLETRCENEGHTTHPCTLQQRESGGEGYTCCDFQGKRQRSGLGRRGLAASVIDDDERDLFVDQRLLGVMTHATVQRALNVAGTLFGEADERQEDEGDEGAGSCGEEDCGREGRHCAHVDEAVDRWSDDARPAGNVRQCLEKS